MHRAFISIASGKSQRRLLHRKSIFQHFYFTIHCECKKFTWLFFNGNKNSLWINEMNSFIYIIIIIIQIFCFFIDKIFFFFFCYVNSGNDDWTFWRISSRMVLALGPNCPSSHLVVVGQTMITPRILIASGAKKVQMSLNKNCFYQWHSLLYLL